MRKDKLERVGIRTKLSFYYTNARSIRNKLNEFKAELHEIQPDIVGISETWLTDKDSDLIMNNTGYAIIRRDRVDRKDGGVMIMIKSGIHYDIDHTGNNLTEHHFESVWCKIKLEQFPLIVWVCYRSGATNDDDFLKEALVAANSKSIIMGDFNYPDINWIHETTTSSISNKFIELLRENFLIQNVKEATRQSKILDLILSSNDVQLTDITLSAPLGDSDHSVITGEIKCSRKIILRNYEGWNFKKANFEAISSRLQLLDWNELFKNKEINSMWLQFKNEIINLMNQFIPKFKFKNKKGMGWMTTTVLKEIVLKKNMWRNYKDKDDINLYDKFKQQAKVVKLAVKKAKSDYEEHLAKNSKINPKGIFRYIARKNNNNEDLAIKDNSGELIYDSFSIAKIFNEYFASIFIESAQADNFRTDFISDEYICITKKEVLEHMNKINPNKSVGLDGIPSLLVKSCADAMAAPLTAILNQSLKEGKVPEDWKLAKVTQIHKGGIKSDVSNYRPVSLTPVLSKIMEKVIRQRMLEFLDENDVVYIGQHGFVKDRSCLTNLLTFYEDVTRELDRGNGYVAIYLDFRKAFDTVNQIMLLQKLNEIKIPKYICKWIEHWLIGRSQCVVYKGKYSLSCEVKSGVPQGSVLGPMLFNIYINDIYVNIGSKLLLFADDIKIGRSIKNSNDYRILQEDLNKLNMWATKWDLSFNINKCKVIHFGRKRTDWNFTINGEILEYVSEYKDLGILIDEKLKFRNHIGKITASAQRSLGLIKYTFLLVVKKKFYYPYIRQ